MSARVPHTAPPPPPPPSRSATRPVQIDDPRPPKRGAFALTPLADVMFQLLIFFMLSTSLAPYALLPLGGPTAPQTNPSPRAPQQSGGSQSQIIWHVGKGEVRAGQAALPLEALPDALVALKAEGLTEILLFTTPAAETQDLATTLEAIRVAEIARVRLISRPGQGG